MNKILCATRGGEASIRTQEAVIAMAKKTDATIVFLYVVDVEFLRLTARGVRPEVVMLEMERLGEFLLAMAVERAQVQGVQAEMVVRRGTLLDALISVAREESIDTIALGRPAGTDSSFSLADIEALAARIEADTGIATSIV